MHIVDYVILSFVVGATVGFSLALLQFRSRLKFYKALIERRLTEINRRLGHSGTSPDKRSRIV